MEPEGIRYDSLEGLSQESLHATFLAAFADYEVPLDLPFPEFRRMQARRGVSPAAGLGAFAGDELVGFICNGVGTWKGRPCAYDAGTGVLPSWRGRGLSGALAGECARRLAARGFETWLLEVLVSNEKAIKTYRRAGFRPTRRLAVREGALPEAGLRAAAAAGAAGVAIVQAPAFDPARYASFRDWEPTWQNADESLARDTLPPLVLEARAGAEVLGYVAATERGSVAQLAVARRARRRGLGRALLLALAALVPGGSLRYVNVQEDDAASLGLLDSLGIGGGLGQWEMELALAPR